MKYWVLSAPVGAAGTTKACLGALLICFTRERRAALSFLYLWGTVSLKPTRYNARIILSNSGLGLVAFFPLFLFLNFPEVFSTWTHLIFQALSALRQSRGNNSCKAKKTNLGFCPVLRLTLLAICNKEFIEILRHFLQAGWKVVLSFYLAGNFLFFLCSKRKHINK